MDIQSYSASILNQHTVIVTPSLITTPHGDCYISVNDYRTVILDHPLDRCTSILSHVRHFTYYMEAESDMRVS